MKKTLFQEITIPKEVNIDVNDNTLTVKGPKGELTKTFRIQKLKLEKKENTIIIGHEKATKTEKKLMNTLTAHIKNMITGVQEEFTYTLKICFGHFPFTVKKEQDTVIIKNFLGEKVDRIVKIPKGANIEIDQQIITIKSVDKEIAGQASANFETATKIRGRDKRIFQDGIYIINKNGKAA